MRLGATDADRSATRRGLTTEARTMTDDPPHTIEIAPHPAALIAAFATRFPAPLGDLETPAQVLDSLRPGAEAPLARDEAVRAAVRDMLRHGGYRPTGRGKPASEYLVRAAEEGKLGSINAAVDACNAASLHSGLPISVVDLARVRPPFRVAEAPPGAGYVFNPSGQEIDLSGLLCLWDADGPCANAVRDAQRSKTEDSTVATLSVVWGTAEHEARLESATAWYRALLAAAGAETVDVEVRTAE
jgi:DNA/RNA-binding domain of Phe-tRNA-synthetase-like protein